MHKNFANTLFLGKRVFFLPQCHSTNQYLLEMVRRGIGLEGDMVLTDYQSDGKGQRGAPWESEPGQNLLFSLNLSPSFLHSEEAYKLNVLIAVSLCQVLEELLPKEEIKIKWPNDLYVSGKKISGILIQTLIDQTSIRQAIVGIGLNVNQKEFNEPKATSLQKVKGHNLNLESLLEAIVHSIEANYLKLRNGSFEILLATYHNNLYWRGELHEFKSQEDVFIGEIIGIDRTGSLSIRLGDKLKTYRVKEVEYLR